MQSLINLPDGQSRFFALFGKELGRSPSPATHTRWARTSGINLQYAALPIHDEAEFISVAQSLCKSPLFGGGNITNPFKAAALRLDSVNIDSSAIRCGAANTLYRNQQKESWIWSVANTDLAGCSESLKKILEKRHLTPQSLWVAILGSGAMMRTTLCALEDLPGLSEAIATGFVLGRAPAFETDMAAAFLNQSILPLVYRQIQESNLSKEALPEAKPTQHLLCINTLPCGTSTEADTLARTCLAKLENQTEWASKNLFCVSYGDLPLHSWASQKGWSVMNGNLLFDVQARASFKLWTGLEAPNLPTALQQT
jgi:shikimate 5-dehydrogenase